MNSRYSKSKIAILVVVIISCLGVLLYEPIKTHLVTSYQPTYTAQPSKLNKQSLYKPVSYDMNKAKPVTLHQVINARLHAKQMRIAGQLIDPDAHLHLPIGLGVGGNTLMLAAGTMRQGEQMGQGNYALAGHHMLNSKALFTPLYLHAKRGQMIYITDMHKIYAYRLYLRKVVDEHDVGIVNNTKGQPIITLVTCNSGRLTSKRLELRGKLTHIYQLKQSSQAVRKILTGKTNNYKVLKGY